MSRFFLIFLKMTTLKITLENKHKYIDEYGNLTVPPEIKKVTCNYLQLTSLVVPKGVKELWCYNNKLTSLIVHEGMQKLWCYNNNLTSLDVPKGIQELWCSHNKLTSLIVPKGVQELYCSNNNLTSLIVPKGVQELYCSNNNLTSLIVPKGMQKLWCSNNNLTSLVVPEGIQKLDCSYNKLIYINFKSPESLKYIDINDNKDMIYPPKEYHSKSAKEIVEWCTSHKIPQRLLLPERWEKRWNAIKLMYIAHYKESLGPLDSPNFNFNIIPIEIITGIITRYALT